MKNLETRLRIYSVIIAVALVMLVIVNDNSTLLFLVLSLATWRMASLVANETGPFYVFKRIREFAKYLCDRFWLCREFHLDELLECEWCNSVWFGTAWTLALYYSGQVSMPTVLWLAYPLGLSSMTIIIKYVVHLLDNVQYYYHRQAKKLTGD